MQLTDKVILTDMAQKLAKPLAKSVIKAVLVEVGGLALLLRKEWIMLIRLRVPLQ